MKIVMNNDITYMIGTYESLGLVIHITPKPLLGKHFRTTFFPLKAKEFLF